MQTRNATTINQSLKRDDVIDLESFGAHGVDSEYRFSVNPRRGSVLHVFSPVVFSLGVERIVSPPFAPRGVDSVYTGVVTSLLRLRNAVSVALVSLVSLSTPGFALVADGRALPVVVGARLIDAADGADLESKRFRAFHSNDILPKLGDTKPRELLEKREPPISSRADQEWSEGSETRARSPDRTVKPHERAARIQREEIVRAAWLNVQRPGIKSLGDNKLTTIQNRSGDLADNV